MLHMSSKNQCKGLIHLLKNVISLIAMFCGVTALHKIFLVAVAPHCLATS